MCGLLAVYMRNVDEASMMRRCREGVQLLSHRGPDGHGIWIDHDVSMVHTRLAILDLSDRASQPLHDKSGRYVIVFNGEIYNFRELRHRLAAEGIHVQSSGDTEVLLHWVMHYGVEGLDALEGMYAFVIFDRLDRRMIAARDPMGIKPLLIYEGPHGVVFASEAKAILPWMTPALDPWTAGAFLATGHTPQIGRDLLQGVHWLDAGCSVVVQDGIVQKPQRFFHLTQLLNPRAFGKSKNHRDELDGIIAHAVRETMVSDVPVASLCSGGVDSSLVAAMGIHVDPDLRLFHADVQSGRSERKEAEAIATFLQRPLACVTTTEASLQDHMPSAVWHFEAPIMKHPNSIPMMQLMEHIAAQGIKVVVSGEGADEAFLGYPLFVRRMWSERARRVSDTFGSALRRLPVIRNWLSDRPRLAGDLLQCIESREDQELDAMVLNEFPAHERLPLAWAMDKLRMHLQTLLRRNDRMGMAHGVEARFPLLHRSVLQFALNTPVGLKLRPTLRLRGWDVDIPGYRTKWILRKVAEKHIPAFGVWRAKCGFPTATPDLTALLGSAEHFHVRDALGWTVEETHRYCMSLGHTGLQRIQQLELWHRLFVERMQVGSCDVRRAA